MSVPSATAVRDLLTALSAREQKIVLGLFAVMIRFPDRVREREWMSEQLTHLALLAGDFEADSVEHGTQEVRTFLHERSGAMESAATALFARVAADLAPRIQAEGFTAEDAMGHALSLLVPAPMGNDDKADDRPNRNLGEQPIARVMADRELTPNDLVRASGEQLTHKMVTRAMRGRRLTANTMDKVVRALSRATGDDLTRAELFDYEP
ncbi:MAG: hypothetical protein H6832_02630 [Planctomycetes bacterium]|nr:hypothetical protein [Planctomycetota bacterium]MCB9917281.1 hypothetical protein [Planctomycetota bacterium]